MSRASLAALTASLLLLLTACGGGSDAQDGNNTSADDAASAAPPPPKFSKIHEFPGQELPYNYMGDPLSLRVKPIDTEWTPELVGRPAKAGSRYLAVYVAVAGELADRSVKDADLNGLQLKVRDPANCQDKIMGDQCGSSAYPLSQLEPVADNTWRTHKWHEVSIMGNPIKPGETVIGVVGFSIQDAWKVTDISLCSPSKNDVMTMKGANCVALKPPPRP